MNLEAIAGLLEDAGLGAQGQSIFINSMPENLSGFMLREGYSGNWINWDFEGNWYEGDFVLTYRCPKAEYADGMEQIKQAMETLTLLYGATVGEVEYKYMRPRQTPMVYPVSGGGNVEFTVHIDVCFLIV